MFGYNLFQGVPSTFAPLDRVPVTPDYIVGPGDELLVRAWGAVEIDYRVIVDRDGTISIPRVGTITVSGVRFQDLHPLLKTAIGRVFRNFELSVTMGQLRSIQVFVVGHAVRPGSYTVSSLSTLVNALFASGGPTVKGSMRSIQVKRRDKLVTEFDMYDLLVRGDKSKDVRLFSGDVIYIPPIGSLVAASGSVNNPAIYELKGEKNLGELLSVAGGLTTTADAQKVTVERIVGRRSRNVEEFALNTEGLAHPLRDGDVIMVLRLSPRFDNTVTVRGNVAVAARHPWRAGMRVRDVVPDRESLITPDYWVRRNMIIRPDVTGREDYGLRPEIALDLRQPRASAQDTEPNKLQGAMPETETDRALRQLTAQQGRTQVNQHLPEVNWDYAVVERLKRDDLTTQLIPFNLGKAILESDPQNNLVLQPGDIITIFSKFDIKVPVAKQTQFVKLEGELVTPGVYQVLPGETLRQLVARVGGFTRNAYPYGAELSRESVRVQQQRRLDESLDRLAQEIERTASTQSQKVIDPADAGRAQVQAENQRRLLERMRTVRATGRIVLDMKPDAELRDIPEVALEDGDRFVVPARPSTVGVVGSVYNQNTFLHSDAKRVGEYISQAGGATREADSGRVYVIRADGLVVPRRGRGGFLTVFTDDRLQPGDTIVVPENLDRFSLTRELKDWSQIFYQFALGVAGLKVLKDL
jgi:protein involved in polysaccharide export with SLBB domain